jgi:putative cardiolipin synthase
MRLVNLRRLSSLGKSVMVVLLSLFVLYLLVGGVFVFVFHRSDGDYAQSIDSQRFFSEGIGVDRALVVEDRINSAIARINLIEHAVSSISLAYYTVHDGISSDVFYASLLEAADRGVSVRLLFDGIFHNLKGKQRATLRALVGHPNVEVRFYEPLNILLPWTLQNRLHDKILIIDDTYALIGGRNIGDKYFIEPYAGSVVEDRDILIINSTRALGASSVLDSFASYFTELWESRYTKEKRVRRSPGNGDVLLQRLAAIRGEYPQLFIAAIDWDAWALPTARVTLITNPLARFNKEPHILMELMGCVEQSSSSLWLQSPYIIPSRSMQRSVKRSVEGVDIRYLTNSVASSPNYFATAGHLKHRAGIAAGTTLLEYEGEGSIHAKTYVFDGRLSMVGSFNLDARSSFLSTESMVVIDSVPVAESLSKRMEKLAHESVPYGSHEVQRKPVPAYKRGLVLLSRILLHPFDWLL